MQFQKRDAEILKWVNGFGFATVDQIKGFMKVGNTAAYVRIKKLVEGGYLARERILHGQARIHKVTKRGVIASGDHILPVQDIRLGTFKHDLALVDLALKLEEETGGQFIPQRQIRHDEGLSGVGQMGHIPDGYLFIDDDKPVAVELELSVKSRARLNSIVQDYGGDLRVKEVWYYTNQKSVYNALEKATQGYSFIKIKFMSEYKDAA
ncbi:MAG: hypothetical protein GC137_00290 [Alphaproteobacteria bacterium]|nr:hypothetical protein [Alphaproteobacteria bacterium]